jgi:hypothetical protein
MYEVMDGQAHKMMMLIVASGIEDLYSISIKLCIDD